MSDNPDVSISDPSSLMASAMDRAARLVSLPAAMSNVAAILVGRTAEASRLTGSLWDHIDKKMQSLQWSLPVLLADGVRSAVSCYKERGTDAQF